MINNKNLKELIQKQFDCSELKKVNFGMLEGERDPLLESSFFPTDTVEKYLFSPYNYVLSPKGGGKSALFRSLENRFIEENMFKYLDYSIIPINEAFGFNDDYLNVNKFKENSRMRLTVSWGVFLLTSLIHDIQNNHSDKKGFKSLMSKLAMVSDFKEKFNLYNLSDFLNNISASISFIANGQEFEVSPKIKFNQRKNKLEINKLFKEINDFYKSINKSALILIDRIDNFVQKEEYELQRRYIQGLFDCIEEISLLSNIQPTLFLRTDLFYSYGSDIEYDKFKDRTIELKWSMGETLNFIVYRLDANKYFHENFRPFIDHFIEEASKGEHRYYKEEKISVFSWLKQFFGYKNGNNLVDTKKSIDYTISKKYIDIFFPRTIITELDEKPFTDWIFTYLKDANDFINPRLLIYFFNQLLKNEIKNRNNLFPDAKDIIEPEIINGCVKYNIFHPETIFITYEKIKEDELKNIYTLVKKKEFQTLFRIINTKVDNNSYFKYGDINVKNMKIDKQVFDSLIKYLKLLGYCKEVSNQKYTVPLLYRKILDLS